MTRVERKNEIKRKIGSEVLNSKYGNKKMKEAAKKEIAYLRLEMAKVEKEIKDSEDRNRWAREGFTLYPRR